ncbi:MAG: bifunctional folylpolyglutamate synthase/dihydrofolate synthase [Bacteroidetes bacterium]|nr:bifunctional folylpolyglutamate synthase/dihydrofolate synthase [Bacteroidota bacterium]
MNYQETIQWLFNQLPMYQRQGKAAYKADLENTLNLDKYFNHPHKNYRSIHVAGTNGKGSVSHMLASILQEAGYKVGLYTSPHLKDFKERIRINGHMIPEDFVVEFVQQHKGIFEEIKPSFFEMTVAMAFEYFAQEKIDVAVVEVGMGGRLDSTNIIHPDLSIITNIGLDHTVFLGDSLEKIATEKAGIIKENVPVIIGETQKETKQVFLDKAIEKQTAISFADQYYDVDYALLSAENKQVFNVKHDNKVVYGNLKLDLLGSYQQNNMVTVLKAVDVLNMNNYNLDLSCIYNGLFDVAKNTGLKGRWQILDHNPLTVCDTAHNLEGLKYVVEQIKQTAYKKLHMVFGVVDDKNIEHILKILPQNAEYYFTKASIPRALDEKILYQKANQEGLKGHYYDQVALALKKAKKNATSNDLIFIGGSTFVVAEVV